MGRDWSGAALGLMLALGLWLAPGLAEDLVRPSALAGTWYPGDPKELAQRVDELLSEAAPATPPGTIRALVVPHAGYAYSGRIAAAAFALVRGRQYRRVLLLAPSHHADFRGLSIAGVDAYSTPLGKVPLDGEAVARLRQSSLVRADPWAHQKEHAIEIELPFLQRALGSGWGLVPILVGALEPQDYPEIADLLRPLVDDETLVVVSSDFTHYGARFGYQPFPPDAQAPERILALDEGAIAQVLARDGPGLLDYQARTGITVCGIRPLALLLHLLPADARVERIAYGTSGELTGDWRSSVSYVALAVTGSADPAETTAEAIDDIGQEGWTAPDLEQLHRIAVLGVEAAVDGLPQSLEAEIAEVLAGLPPRLNEPAGAFVTLWSRGRLRGCVGHVPNDLPLSKAVLQSAYQAARRDHRFEPVTAAELSGLEVEINVLSVPQPIESIDAFRIGEHGITLRKGDRYALYLPEVAPHMGWDRDTTLSQLALKAGLPADGWREGATFEVFTTIEYKAPYPAEPPRMHRGAARADADHALTKP